MVKSKRNSCFAVSGFTRVARRFSMALLPCVALSARAATYYWNPAVSAGNWSDAASWCTDSKGTVPAADYPRTSSDTASFIAGTEADISFTEPLTIGTLGANTANLNLRFVQGGTSTNETQLTVSTFNPNAANGAITLDGVAIRATGSSPIGQGRALRLVNGANLHIGDFTCRTANEVLVADGSWLSCNTLAFGGGIITIDDSTVWTRSHDKVGDTLVGGHIVFRGTHPLWWHNNADGFFYSSLANANVQLDFLVPVGGFPKPPLQAVAGQKYYMGDNNYRSPGAAPFTVNVLDESPANFVEAVTETCLIDWPKGINKDRVLQGDLPAYGPGTVSDDSFAWLAAEADYPTNLLVAIRGSSHAGDLQITGAPEAFAVPGLSPGYGYTAVAQGNSLTCSAPAEYYYVSPTQRVVCAGWKLYAVDAATLSRTLERSGAGETSCTYANTSGVWHELEWQWRVEYLVSAAPAAGGAVVPASQWIVAGETASVTAMPDGGYVFSAWTNGLPEGADAKAAKLTFTGNEPWVLYAAFTAPVHVAVSGNDNAGDGSEANPFATVAAGIAACPDGGVVLVHPGPYTLASEITLARDITIRGETGDPDDVTLTAAAKSRLFTLNHASARLEALTLTGGRPSAGNGGCVLINAAGGTLANCVLRDGIPQAWGGSGGGFAIAANARTALVTHCVVTGCNANLSGNGVTDRDRGGTAAYVAAGMVRNCLFTGNGSTATCSNSGGTILLRGGTLENCTIAGNANYYNPGFSAYSGKAVNCLVGANTNVYSDCATALAVSGALTCLTNCAAEMPVNEWCFSSPRLFRDELLRDWRPASAAINAAAPRDWMAGAADLAGDARVQGGAPDIGCYESDSATFAILATPSSREGVAPFALTLALNAYGAAGTPSYEIDWEGNGSYEAVAGASAIHEYAAAGDFAVAIRATDGQSAAVDTLSISIRPPTLYVDAASGAPAFPFATPATAATTLAAALDAAVDGCEIIVAPVPAGYPIASQVEIRKAVAVRGATGNPEDVLLKMSGSNHRIVFMNNPRASLSAVTVHGGYINNNATPFSKNGSGVCIGPTGGTLSNCVVRSCNIYTWNCEGAGIYVFAGADNALVTHCVVTNCTRATSSSGDRGVALAMYGGHVRNCLFAYNRATAGNSSQTHAMGTVFVGGGTLENCTVVKNDSYNCSGVYASGGEVRNCAIGLNTSSLISGNADYVVWAGKAQCFSNCLAPILINADCIQEDESSTYVAAESGDFALAATSDGADAAAAAEWMAGATDLAGNPRIRGEAPDIGAWEADADALAATLVADGAAEGFPPFTAAFSAAVVNAEGTQAFFWDWDGDGIFDEETSSPTASHTFSQAGSYVVSLKVRAANGEYAVPGTVRVTVVPRVLYVDPASESPAEPYDTWGNAATAIQTAVDYAIGGCEIVLASTEHVVRTPVSVTKAVWIHGATSNPADTVVRNAVKSGNGADGTSTCRLFTLTGAGAKLSDLTAADGYIGNNATELSRDGGGLHLAGVGVVVSNCVVRGCQAWYWGTCGGAVFVSPTAKGALVTHCVISNNLPRSGAGTVSGSAIYLAAGTARNCLLAHNRPPATSGQTSAAYTAYLAGGTLENCTVAGNYSAQQSGVYAGSTAAVTNCVIAANETGGGDAYAVYGGSASRFFRCLGDRVLINGECLQAAAANTFKNAEAGDFRLAANSPAANKGARLGWMAGGTDLAGKPRLVSKPDIGCYECQSGARTLLLLR